MQENQNTKRKFFIYECDLNFIYLLFLTSDIAFHSQTQVENSEKAWFSDTEVHRAVHKFSPFSACVTWTRDLVSQSLSNKEMYFKIKK